MPKFTVGKKYLTRIGLDATITAEHGNLLIGTVTKHEDYGSNIEQDTEYLIWYGDGSCMFSGKSNLDLMESDDPIKRIDIIGLHEISKKLQLLNHELVRENKRLIAENRRLIIGLKELYEKNTALIIEREERNEAIERNDPKT